MLTWTDNPERALWDQLLFLSHEKNLEQLLLGKLSTRRTPIPNQEKIELKAKQAAYCIQQAYEYYQAAKATTISTSPLQLYYGMLSLAKAVILCETPKLLLDDIKYHGLSTRPASSHTQQLAQTSAGSLDKQFAVVSGGVFKELCEILSTTNLVGNSFELGDLLKCDPQLSLLYDRLNGNSSGCLPLYNHGQNHSNQTFVEVTSTIAEIAVRIPKLKDNAFEIVELANMPHHIRVSELGTTKISELAKVYHIPAGGRVLRAHPRSIDATGNPANKYVSVETCDYALMFILSNCVRYKQDLWRSCQIEGTQSEFSMIPSFISSSIRRYPNKILDVLFKENHNFGSAAYMT